MTIHAVLTHIGRPAMHRRVSRMGLILVGVWLLLGSLTPVIWALTSDEETLFFVATQAYHDGLYDLARDQLQTYVTTFPRGKHLAEVFYLLGDYHFRQRDFTQAVQLLRDALRHQLPEALQLDAHYLLGRSALEVAEYSEAIQAFQALLETGKGGRWQDAALYYLSEALLRSGDVGLAIQPLKRLTAEFPNSPYMEQGLYALGYAQQTSAAHEQSLRAFQQLLIHFPQGQLHRAAEYGVAHALSALQRFAEAAPRWEQLSHTASSPAEAEEAAFWWAESWRQAGQCERARPAFEEYLRRFPQRGHRPQALNALAICARSVDDLKAESTALEALLKDGAGPSGAAITWRLVEIYIQLNDCAAAQPHLTVLIEQGDQAARQQARVRRGTCAYQAQAFTMAAEDFGALVDDSTYDGDRQALLLPLGYSLAARQRHPEAIARFRQFLAVDPEPAQAAQALTGLGGSLLATGRVEEALPVYEQLLSIASDLPERARLQLWLGLQYRQHQQPERAIPHLQAAVEGADTAIGAEALYQWSDLLLAEGATDQAVMQLERLLKQFASEDRWVGIAAYRLALIHEAAERWPMAWQAYHTAATAAADPKLADAARQRAQHLEETVDVHARPEPGLPSQERPL